MLDHSVDQNSAGTPGKPLTEAVTEILERNGHPRPRDWLAGLDSVAFRDDVPDDYKRFLINRYWRNQIGSLPENTMDVRYCLVDSGPIDRWLALFEQGVAKCIVTNQLPPIQQ